MATEGSQSVGEMPAGEQPSARRSPFMKLAVRLGVFIGLISAVLCGSQFLLPPHQHRVFEISIALAPASAQASQVALQLSGAAPRSRGGHLIVDPALIEDSPLGPLPVVAPDGRAPMK